MTGIGFFAPLPLAMMMPFMAGQSMIMGDAFGKSYQYGKRKISAMSNEEFNKLTPKDLATQLQTDYLSMIPSLKASVKASTEFQSFIIRELAEIIKNLPPDIYKAITDNNPLTAEASPGNIIPQAFGSNNQKSNASETDWIKVLSSLAQNILGMRGGPVISGPGPNPETEEERIRNDLLIQQQTKQNQQRDLEEIRRRNIHGNVVPKRPAIGKDVTPKTLLQKTHGAQINQYKFTVATLLQRVQQSKRTLQNAVGGAAVKAATIKLKRDQRTLMNFITVKRNVIYLKPAANTDWRNQIWK